MSANPIIYHHNPALGLGPWVSNPLHRKIPALPFSVKNTATAYKCAPFKSGVSITAEAIDYAAIFVRAWFIIEILSMFSRELDLDAASQFNEDRFWKGVPIAAFIGVGLCILAHSAKKTHTLIGDNVAAFSSHATAVIHTASSAFNSLAMIHAFFQAQDGYTPPTAQAKFWIALLGTVGFRILRPAELSQAIATQIVNQRLEQSDPLPNYSKLNPLATAKRRLTSIPKAVTWKKPKTLMLPVLETGFTMSKTSAAVVSFITSVYIFSGKLKEIDPTLLYTSRAAAALLAIVACVDKFSRVDSKRYLSALADAVDRFSRLSVASILLLFAAKYYNAQSSVFLTVLAHAKNAPIMLMDVIKTNIPTIIADASQECDPTVYAPGDIPLGELSTLIYGSNTTAPIDFTNPAAEDYLATLYFKLGEALCNVVESPTWQDNPWLTLAGLVCVVGVTAYSVTQHTGTRKVILARRNALTSAPQIDIEHTCIQMTPQEESKEAFAGTGP